MLISQKKNWKSYTRTPKKIPPKILLYRVHLQIITMITSTTPDKLAEIIRDTWPNLYRPSKIPYNKEKNLKDEKVQ
jgi:hypothetical protein